MYLAQLFHRSILIFQLNRRVFCCVCPILVRVCNIPSQQKTRTNIRNHSRVAVSTSSFLRTRRFPICSFSGANEWDSDGLAPEGPCVCWGDGRDHFGCPFELSAPFSGMHYCRTPITVGGEFRWAKYLSPKPNHTTTFSWVQFPIAVPIALKIITIIP